MNQQQVNDSVVKGDSLTKNELKSRLHQMEIDFNTHEQKKRYYEELYDKAIKITANRKKIEDKLQREMSLVTENQRKRTRDTSEDARQDLRIVDKQPKLEEKSVININRIDDKYEEIVSVIEETEVIRPKPVKLPSLSDAEIAMEKRISDNTLRNPFIRNETSTNHGRVGVTTTKISFALDTTSTSNNNNININTNPGKKTVHSEPVSIKQDKSAQLQQQQEKNINKHTINNINNINLNPIQPSSLKEQLKRFQSNSEKEVEPPIFDRINEQIQPETHFSSTPNFYFNSNKNDQNINNNPTVENSVPIIEVDFNILKNKAFQVEFEKLKKLYSAKTDDILIVNEPLIKPLSPVHVCNYTESINGGELEEVQIIRMDVLPDKKENVLPIIKKFEESEKWKLENAGVTSIRNLVKYFVAGMVCSVMFYGLLYCIQNCPEISFENIGLNSQKATISGINLDDKIRQTIPSKLINLGIELEPEVIVQGPSFSDKIIDFFSPLSNVYWAITNPKEFLIKIIYHGVKYLAFELAWTYFKRNIWYFLGIFTLKMIAYKAYKTYTDRRTASSVFHEVKDRLRTMYDCGRHLEGISEEEIVREYAKDYNLKEDYFRSHIMPRLKNLRQSDQEIKEFEIQAFGRNRIAWQYYGVY